MTPPQSRISLIVVRSVVEDGTVETLRIVVSAYSAPAPGDHGSDIRTTSVTNTATVAGALRAVHSALAEFLEEP